MDTLSYSVFRAQLAGVLDKVNNDHKPMMITRQNGKSAVVMILSWATDAWDGYLYWQQEESIRNTV